MIPNIKMLIRLISSVKVTVACLLIMVVLVVWGTLFEASEGLLAAHERFFQSWFFRTSLNIPFPGVKLVSVVLLLNLLPSFLKFLLHPFLNSGLILIHLGIVFLFSGVLFSSQFTREYFLPIYEGQTTGSALSYEISELALYKVDMSRPDVYYTTDSLSLENMRAGHKVFFPNANIQCTVSAIDDLTVRDARIDQKFSMRRVTLTLENNCASQSGKKIVVQIGEQPVQINCNTNTFFVGLRPASVKLPVQLKLTDFYRQFHTGTETLKEVRSHVSVRSGSTVRDVVISMNKPLRHGSYTFYQESFFEQDGKEFSKLSIVYNPLRFFPYAASLTIMGGLFLHLILMTIRRYKSRNRKLEMS